MLNVNFKIIGFNCKGFSFVKIEILDSIFNFREI